MSAQLAVVREPSDGVDAALMNRARFATKLAQAQRAVRNVPKSERNQQQNYNFAPTESIFSMLRPILADCGLAVLVDTVGVDKTTGTSSGGKPYDLGRVRLDITLIDTETGYSETAHGFEGEGLDYGGDKALPKAYTMAMKYWARVMFMIDLQADAEADRARQLRRQEPPAPASPAPSTAPKSTTPPPPPADGTSPSGVATKPGDLLAVVNGRVEVPYDNVPHLWQALRNEYNDQRW